jgi:hypothetical protein
MALRHNPQTRKTTTMTKKDKIARFMLSLLEFDEALSNASRACKVMGYSREKFYEIRRNFHTYGSEGLIDRLPRREVAAPELGCSRERDGDPRPCP